MEVFLFPLVNVTLFPGTTKPLNVFEPRYLAMIQDAIKAKAPIAVGFIEDTAKVSPLVPGQSVPFVREVAGYGYAQIIEERLNGTLLVFLQGEGKVRLGKVKDTSTDYAVVEAEVVVEKNNLDPENATQLNSLHRSLSRWIYTHIPDPGQRDMFLRNITTPEQVVGSFATYLIRDYDMQHIVLELNDINEKVQFLYRLMESSELTS